MINFRKGNKDAFVKLPPEAGFDKHAGIIRQNLAEVFGSRNLSFLIGTWLGDDNAEPSHSTHAILTPDEAYDSKAEPMRITA